MHLNARDRVLYGSPLSRPRVARFVAIALAVLVLLSLVLQVRTLAIAFSADALKVYGLALLGSSGLALMPLAIVYFLDRRERENHWLLLITFLWGAVVAGGFAMQLNRPMMSWISTTMATWVQTLPKNSTLAAIPPEVVGQLASAALSSPVVEEGLKGLGVLLLFWLLRSEFDSVRDGFIYGALVGVGFNWFESAFYVLTSYANTQPDAWLQLSNRQALLGLGNHALWTGLFGLFLGLARQTTRAWVRYLAPPFGWLLGLFAHAVNNNLLLLLTLLLGVPLVLPDLPLPLPTDGLFWYTWLISGSLDKAWRMLPFLAIALVMLWRSGVWERRVIRKELADETYPVITPEEYEAVQGDRPFKTRRIRHVNRRVSAALVQAQNELAIRKWRIRHQGDVPETDPVIASWRAELARLRETH